MEVTYCAEVERLKNHLTILWTRGVGTGTSDVIDPGPLVYKEGLVTILEPGEVAQPFEVGRDRSEIRLLKDILERIIQHRNFVNIGSI